ncbi:hypothetical protein D3C84_677190 [compost metagenome]
MNVRVARVETGQARRQPQGGERGEQADAQGAFLVLIAPQFTGGEGDGGEGRLNLPVVGCPGWCQIDSPGAADKQPLIEELFQFLHLMADCTLGHRQFIGGLDETQMTRHGLEGAQGHQGRQILVQFHSAGPLGPSQSRDCALKKRREHIFC